MTFSHRIAKAKKPHFSLQAYGVLFVFFFVDMCSVDVEKLHSQYISRSALLASNHSKSYSEYIEFLKMLTTIGLTLKCSTPICTAVRI